MAHSAPNSNQASSLLPAQEGKYLIFTLKEEGYGIAILNVREIIGIMNITPIPQTPSYVKGLINLRGRVIPVIDLRLKFDLAAVDYHDRTCIIVVEVGTERAKVLMGLVVDAVSEVLNIGRAEIEPPPHFGSRVQTDYFLGIAKTKGELKYLLDLNRVLSTDEMTTLANLAYGRN